MKANNTLLIEDSSMLNSYFHVQQDIKFLSI